MALCVGLIETDFINSAPSLAWVISGHCPRADAGEQARANGFVEPVEWAGGPDSRGRPTHTVLGGTAPSAVLPASRTDRPCRDPVSARKELLSRPWTIQISGCIVGDGGS